MGAIRGVLLVLASVLLFISILAGGIFLTLALSVDSTNIQEEIGSDILDSAIGDINVKEVIEENIPDMQEDCDGKTEFSFEDPNTGKSFTIPCDIIVQGSDSIIEYGIDTFVEEIYYEDYDCGFWNCFEKTGSPLFLISEKAQNYWNNKFYFSLIAFVILIILMFFLVEKKSNTFVIAGSLTIISSLPFMKLDSILSLFSDKSILGLLTIFFAKSYIVFLIMLITGIIILAIGIIMKFFGMGFAISNLFKGKGKEVSKKDVGKPKKEVSKKIDKKIIANKSKKIVSKKSIASKRKPLFEKKSK